MNEAKIREYLDFGGVRLEDNVIVTQNGIEHLTFQHLPRTIDQVEQFMAGEAVV